MAQIYAHITGEQYLKLICARDYLNEKTHYTNEWTIYNGLLFCHKPLTPGQQKSIKDIRSDFTRATATSIESSDHLEFTQYVDENIQSIQIKFNKTLIDELAHKFIESTQDAKKKVEDYKECAINLARDDRYAREEALRTFNEKLKAFTELKFESEESREKAVKFSDSLKNIIDSYTIGPLDLMNFCAQADEEIQTVLESDFAKQPLIYQALIAIANALLALITVGIAPVITKLATGRWGLFTCPEPEASRLVDEIKNAVQRIG